MAYTGLTNDQIAHQELHKLFVANDYRYYGVDLGQLADRISRRLQSLGYVVPEFAYARTLAQRTFNYAIA